MSSNATEAYNSTLNATKDDFIYISMSSFLTYKIGEFSSYFQIFLIKYYWWITILDIYVCVMYMYINLKNYLPLKDTLHTSEHPQNIEC